MCQLRGRGRCRYGNRRYGTTMIIVAGELRMQAGSRALFFEAVASMVEVTRTEVGCITYAFTPDPTDPDLIRLFEVWETAANLAAHLGSAHMAEWVTTRASLPITSRDLAKYTISAVEPLA
jgi:quinol monooxygenase YgiN